MNSADVRKNLEKNFGAPRETLAICGKAKSSSATTYYYTLPNLKNILQTREVLESGLRENENEKFEDLIQMYPTRRGKNSDLQCACVTEYGENWTVSFYEIVGVKYHRSYGQHISPLIVLAKKPTVVLSSYAPTEYFYGFWWNTCQKKHQKSKGMSYWVNKNIYFNSSFRAFAVDFFSHEATLTKQYILKDVSRTLDKYGYLLLPFTYAELCNYHTPKELICSLITKPQYAALGKNMNAVDLNLAYLVSVLTNLTTENDYKYLKTFPEQLVHNSFSLNVLFDGIEAEDLVGAYYRYYLSEWCDGDNIASFAKDYAHMCIKNREKVHLGYSYNGLTSVHDEMSREERRKALGHELDLPLLVEPSRFDALENNLEQCYPGEFKRIRDTKSLFEEGEEQHNCVFTRRFIIRSDKASVFHWDYGNKHYTIQFGIDDNSSYFVQEIKGTFNESCVPSVVKELNKRLAYAQHHRQLSLTFNEAKG